MLNPTGKSNPELARLRRMTAFELQNMISTLLYATEATLKKIIKSKDEPEFNKWIARMVLVGSASGDEKRFDILMNRSVGKVSEKLQFFGPGDEPDKEKDLSLEEKMLIIARNNKNLDLIEDE